MAQKRRQRKSAARRPRTYTARAFRMSGFGYREVHRKVDFCIERMHVHYEAFGYYWVNSAEQVTHTVTKCDGSCKKLPVLQEQQFPKGQVEYFRSILGKGKHGPLG
jgi:hypothetical protein